MARPRLPRQRSPARRPPRVRRAIDIVIAIAAALAVPRFAAAALGESAASVAADRKALGATARGVTQRRGYSIHELASGSSTVREYVTPGGVVFAVAWNGLAHPDLTPLLGAYAAEYEQADRDQPRVPGRRRRHVGTERLVVEKWGHMRDLHGRAYAPALVPAGVKLDAIR